MADCPHQLNGNALPRPVTGRCSVSAILESTEAQNMPQPQQLITFFNYYIFDKGERVVAKKLTGLGIGVSGISWHIQLFAARLKSSASFGWCAEGAGKTEGDGCAAKPSTPDNAAQNQYRL
jgi:hypothetical protein